MADPNIVAALGGSAFAHRIGLSAADPLAWFAARADRDRVALRREVLATHGERLAVACDPRALAPVVDFFSELAVRGESFEACARAVAPDLLVVRRDPPALVATAVALPSGWAPEDALGRPVDAIHGVVPGLDALGPRIDRFLRRVETGRAYARANVGLTRGAALDRHPREPTPRLVRGTPGDEVVVRLEEQLLVGLEGLVLFAVHLVTKPLTGLDAKERVALANWLASMPEEVAAYKGLAAIRVELVERLRPRRAPSGP